MFPVSYWAALPKVLCPASLHQQTRFTPANREAVETGSTLRKIQWKPDLNQNENHIKQTNRASANITSPLHVNIKQEVMSIWAHSKTSPAYSITVTPGGNWIQNGPSSLQFAQFVCLMGSAELQSAVCYIPAAETSIWTITTTKTKPDLILLASTLGLNSAKTNLMISMYCYDATETPIRSRQYSSLPLKGLPDLNQLESEGGLLEAGSLKRDKWMED